MAQYSRGSCRNFSVDLPFSQASIGSSPTSDSRNQLGYIAPKNCCRSNLPGRDRFAKWYALLDALTAYGRTPTADSDMTDKRIVLTTAGSEEEARKIARHLVETQLAACVQIIPHVESVYRWKGKVEANREWLLLIKTSADRFPAARDAIRAMHSYELPECVAIDITDGSAEYLEWLAESLPAL